MDSDDNLGISIIGRGSSGVRLFNVAEGEKVVGVARIEDDENHEGENSTDIATEQIIEG